MKKIKKENLSPSSNSEQDNNAEILNNDNKNNKDNLPRRKIMRLTERMRSLAEKSKKNNKD